MTVSVDGINKKIVGAIKTGCMKTPALKSRFCALHKPRAIDIKPIDMPDNVEGEVGDSSTPTTQQTSVIEVAVDKRVTRSATYYKVFWNVKQVPTFQHTPT